MIRKPFMFVILFLSHFTAMNLSMANEFKFGTWLYAGYTESPAEFLELLADTLKFNFLITKGTESNIISLLEAEGIKIAAKNSSPSLIDVPYYYSCSHYSVWEAEGNEFYHDSLKYEIGRFIQDGEVGAWMVSSGLGDTAGLFQYGPYYPQDVRFIGDPWSAPFIHYWVTFKVKAGPDTTPGDDPVAALSVTVTYYSTVYTVVTDTLVDSDFLGFDYMDDTLHYYSRYFHDSLQYTGMTIYGIEFRVHWFGKRDFYIDKVILCDRIGQELMTGLHNREIRDYVYTYFVNSPAIYAWYLREEIPTIDSYIPWRHVDSVLASVDSEKRGFSALCGGSGGPRELLNVIEPKEHHTDCYPLYGKRPWGGDPVAYSSDCPCGDSVSLQTAWNQMIQSFDVNQRAALEKGIDFSTTVQAFSFYRRDLPPGDTLTWYWVWRIPTPYEIECQTNLSLAYGAKGVLYWKYWDGLYYDDGFLYQVSRGLIDSAGNRTENWHWISDKITPFIEKLGETFYNLNWLGACSCDTVNGFVLMNGRPSYIDSIRSHNPADEPHWVQVGFFENQTGDTSYFMLVNRECLETEGANYDVFVTKSGGPYQIRDIYTDSVVDYVNGTGDYFTIYLGPGEGMLLRLDEFYSGERIKHVPAEYPTIQEAINAAWDGDTVLVAPGTYYENINFLGKAITVASHFILDYNPTMIEATIIDGSYPYNPDSASVVTFASGEGSNSILIGFTIMGGTGTSQWGPGRPEHRGGGIFCSYSSPTIINNLIIDNYIPDHGSDFDWGGGIGCLVSSPTIANNLILNNSVLGSDVGGGICLKEGGSPIIVNNTLSDNVRGGIYVWNVSDPFVITNNIIANNTDLGIRANPNSYGITYNDVWNNDGYNFVSCPPEMGDTTWGTDRNGTPCDSFYNLIRDPMFVNPGTDYHSQENSPCINAGDNDAPGLPDFDFDGNPRIMGEYVDMGAYEYITFIRGDANGDGAINSADVVYLINYLFKGGPAPDPFDAGDVNCDELINSADVVYLINYLFKGGPPPCESHKESGQR